MTDPLPLSCPGLPWRSADRTTCLSDVSSVPALPGRRQVPFQVDKSTPTIISASHHLCLGTQGPGSLPQGTLRLPSEKDSLGRSSGDGPRARSQKSLQGSCEVPGGSEGKKQAVFLSRRRSWGVAGLCFLQSVAPVPAWLMTLGENQGNKVRIAQAQEKGHKGEQCGECSAGREGKRAGACRAGLGSGSLEVRG